MPLPSLTTPDGNYSYPAPFIVQEAMCGLMNQMNMSDDLLLRLFPSRNEPNAVEIKFRYRQLLCGVQQNRGVGQRLPIVERQFAERLCSWRPGYWGEKMKLDEDELMRRFGQLTANGCIVPAPTGDLIGDRQQILLYRQFNRQRLLAAQTLIHGKYEALDARTGAVLDEQSYPINRPVLASAPWSDTVNSAPFIDMEMVKLQYEQQTMCKFGAGAVWLMNARTFSWIRRNSNMANWRSIRGEYCCANPTLCQINELLADLDLPQIAIYNESYLDCDVAGGQLFAGQGTLPKKFFFEDGRVVLIGHNDMPRTSIGNGGQDKTKNCVTDISTVGELFYTRNINTCGGVPDSGPVSAVRWYCEEPPVSADVLQYWNGGFALECPQCIVSLMVK